MSLATRCPDCGTVFRVVQDQLKVCEGWVRCGRCSEVFDAALQLFELDAGAPAEAPKPAAHDAPALAPRTEESAPPSEEPLPAANDSPPPAAAEAAPEAAAAAGADATPDFVRRADRAARWHPPARRELAGVALLLGTLLGGQLALHYRDALAAGWPAARPALQAACSVLGCRIEAPRRIHSLGVDSSGLVRLPDSPLYRLSLVLQNRALTAVRMPAIDLALTDTQGHLVVRRVLTAAELGHPAEQLPAAGELALQATLDLGEQRVAGYTIELFYP